MSKGCENHCSLLKQADDTIRKMAEWIAERDTDEDICKHVIKESCMRTTCVDCIIKYFEGLEG